MIVRSNVEKPTALSCFLATPVILALVMQINCASLPRRSLESIEYARVDSHEHWSRRANTTVSYGTVSSTASSEPKLLLLHPWGLTSRVWENLIPVLDAHSVVAIDLPGHGRSGKPAGPYPVARLAAGVADVIDQQGGADVVLIGNSLGGATAIETALRFPHRVIALVLIAAPGGAPLSAPVRGFVRQYANARAIATLSDSAWRAGMQMAAGDASLGTTLVNDILQARDTESYLSWARAIASSLQYISRYEPRLEAISVPTLVIHGEDDLVVSERESRALAERIPGARLIVLEDCGHLPEVECPEALAPHITGFVSRLEKTRQP